MMLFYLIYCTYDLTILNIFNQYGVFMVSVTPTKSSSKLNISRPLDVLVVHGEQAQSIIFPVKHVHDILRILYGTHDSAAHIA